MMMMATETTKKKPLIYEFGPEARDACWSALASSLKRFANEQQVNMQRPVQEFCDSSQHDPQSNDVDTSKSNSDFLSNESGVTYSSEMDTSTRNSEHSSGTTIEVKDDVIKFQPEPLDLSLPESRRRRRRYLDVLIAESRSAEKAFVEQQQLPPSSMNTHICGSNQIQCCPSNNNNNKIINYNNYNFEWTDEGWKQKPECESEPEHELKPEHELQPEPEHESDSKQNLKPENEPKPEHELEPRYECVEDFVGGECSDESEKQQQALQSPEIQTKTLWIPEYLSPLSSKCLTPPSECSLPRSRYMSPSSKSVSPFNIDESTIVAQDEPKNVSERVLYADGNYSTVDDENGRSQKLMDTIELLKSIEHEMRIKKVDNNIEWYCKLFVGIGLFLLIRLLF